MRPERPDAGAVATLSVVSAAEMEALGRRLGALLRRGDLVILSGELGAGKTTLTRGIGEGMGVRGPVTSPTFVLSRVHPPVAAGHDVPLVHVDAYRLGSARELDDLDLDFEGAAVVVEWGDGLLDDVADSWLRIRIDRERSGPASGSGGGALEAVRGGAAAESASSPEADDGDGLRRVAVQAHGPAWTAERLASVVPDAEERA